MIDTSSTTWKFIQDWARGNLEKLREQNDSIGLEEAQTNSIRGKIDLLKDLLRLTEPAPEVEKFELKDDIY